MSNNLDKQTTILVSFLALPLNTAVGVNSVAANTSTATFLNLPKASSTVPTETLRSRPDQETSFKSTLFVYSSIRILPFRTSGWSLHVAIVVVLSQECLHTKAISQPTQNACSNLLTNNTRIAPVTLRKIPGQPRGQNLLTKIQTGNVVRRKVNASHRTGNVIAKGNESSRFRHLLFLH